jgi:hypothetical protein
VTVYQPPPPQRHHPGTTPQPSYGDNDFRGTTRPDRLAHLDINRARRAQQAAVHCYPGVVGQILAREIRAYEDLGWLAERDSLVRQLIDELTTPTQEHQ